MLRSGKRVPAWLALLFAFALVAAACGGGGDDNGDDGGGGGEAGGGSFTMSLCEPEYLIPQKDNETCGGQVLHTLFTPLVLFDAETSEPTYEGAVGESIESEDQITWTVTLKEGWTFHDGTPVTSDSFIKAWNWAAYGPNIAGNSYFFGNVEGYDDLQCTLNKAGDKCTDEPKAEEMSGLTKVSDTEFTVKLTDPFSQFPLTVGYNAFYPLPESFFEDPDAFNDEPIGNGPYQMAGPWEHNQQITVEKYEDYAGEPGNADEITFKIFGEDALNAAFRDLQAGNVDVLDSIPPQQIEAAKTEFGDAFIESPSSSFTYLGFPMYREEFTDPKIRQAISMAIDRQAIIDAIFFGTFTPAKSVVSPVVAGSREDACGTLCEYDPEAAKALWDEAGGAELFADGMTLWFNNDGGHEEWMEAVKNQLQQNLGISKVTFEGGIFEEYLATLDAEGATGPFRLGWVMDYPSPQNYLEPIYHTEGSSNNFGYSNQEVDDLIAEGNKAPSIDEGISFYNQAEDIILEEMPVAPMWFGLNQTAHSPRIDNVVVDAFSFIRLEDVEVVE